MSDATTVIAARQLDLTRGRSCIPCSLHPSAFSRAERPAVARAFHPQLSTNSLREVFERIGVIRDSGNFRTLDPLELLHRDWENTMDNENTPQKKKPIADQMTELAAQAAGALAETAVRAVGRRAKKAVGKRASTKSRPGSPSKAGKKAPKRRAKKAAARKRTAKKTSKRRARKTSKKSKR